MNLIESINRIKNVMGLVVEQSGGFTVPESVIKAISEIEKKYCYMDNGVIKGNTYTGKEKLGVMSQYITDTIGMDCWDNMNDKLKSQIYSFCFQADSSVPYKMKFIAGLANAIDSTISRGSIVNKPITDENVQKAIKTIKDNCQNINSYYDNYLKVIDSQYKSMDYNDNYKNIWEYRPKAIDRIVSGEDTQKVLSDWEKHIKGEPISPTTTQTTSTTTQTTTPQPTPTTKPVDDEDELVPIKVDKNKGI